jgi:3-carboxy-cis,cis-muconate cycloisomerase
MYAVQMTGHLQDASGHVQPPFSLLSALYGDATISELLSPGRTIERWLQVEVALAGAQAQVGDITAEQAAAVRRAARPESIDAERLWREAGNVGYPILPLVEMIVEALPDGSEDRVHYGATTQDIMDTALALQLRDVSDRLLGLLGAVGDALARRTSEHRHTVMAARTHAQQAVPTTLGAKLAVFLDQCARHRRRLTAAQEAVAVVSLHGAGGTSAALGPQAGRVRALVAEELGLRDTEVPWHVARDGLVEFGQACANVTSTLARLAREVVDLARTEVGEVTEVAGHHRGASSTMPQKRNPITSEAVIGLAVSVSALAAGLPRVAEAGHERAAGEWQAEWFLLPHIAGLTASALVAAHELVEGLEASTEAMAANLQADHGLVMAEAWMFRLAPALGRQRAHDLVYEAGRRARIDDTSLAAAVAALEPGQARDDRAIDPASYIGETERACEAALTSWGAAAPRERGEEWP